MDDLKDEKPRKGLLDRKKEVQKRYYRRLIFVTLNPYARSIALKIARIKIRRAERPRTQALEGALVEVVKSLEKTNKDRFPASFVFLNLALYFLIASRDIQTVKLDALTHPDEWRRGLCLRVIALTIHEWDVGKVAGQDLYKALNMIDCPADIRDEINSSLKLVRKSQKSAEKSLKSLRNSVIAHRDADALYQYRTIKNIPADEIFEAAMKFYEASDRFHAVLPKLIIIGSSMPNLIKQFLRDRDSM